MGCCVSTQNPSTSTPTPRFQKRESIKPLKSRTRESRTPPPSLEELETVKEVLSETPKPVKSSHQEQQHKSRESNKTVLRIEPPPLLDEKIRKGKILLGQEEIFVQEGSEVCSFSESVSTTTINNKSNDDEDDDDQEVEQRGKRSPAPILPMRNRNLGPRQDRDVGKSPTRRSEKSLAKRNNVGVGGGGGGGGGSGRLVQSKEWGSCQAGRRSGLRPHPNRRDSGESSGRRSRSPANNRSVMGRSPSANRTNRSPGRIRKDPVECCGSNMNVEKGMENNKWTNSNSSTNGSANESLENPLVSLECFIFL